MGPLSPFTEKGNRYILTLVDYSSCYPEALALPSIETERVAEALMEIFSRVGIPREMLTDMGTQCTSSLMEEVSRLISTTPQHPSCNGWVERFNGTLKQILKRHFAKKPKDWDKYLNAIFFAYRELPQKSLGISPFEIVCGRFVRGPMSILKELCTKEIEDTNVKNNLSLCFKSEREIAVYGPTYQRKPLKSATRYKKYYDKKARNISLKVGDTALILIPTDFTKLLLQWKGFRHRKEGKPCRLPVENEWEVNATFVDCVGDSTQEGQLDDYPALDSDQGTEVDVNGLLST
ncbi:uncharacterized protein LOC133203392 [Saccostrea echinata]|uniref:uncharacterized protein LOC133203392 n=1 Tax=Saccostrea echinata TaxID=191078 RepID=UPI002A8217BA|nr:uncharacterized protein LOC133203392 [Saccostrea echinata]